MENGDTGFSIAALQNILVLANHSEKSLSKSNAQVGQFIQTSRAICEGFSMRSFVVTLVNQVIFPFLWKRKVSLFSIFCNRFFV